MCNVAAIIDMSRNGYLYRPTTKKDPKGANRDMFHYFPSELQLTAVMAEMEDAPVIHQSKNQSLELQRDRKPEKEELKQELVLENE